MRAIGAGTILIAAVMASAGLAQDTSMTSSMGGPMAQSMPDPTQDLTNAVRAVDERNQTGREQRAALMRQRAAERREQARLEAAALASGVPAPVHTAATIRAALEDDLEAWRSEFNVGRREWRSMRETWLPDEASMTVAEWAAHRLNWFAARDAWIAERGLGG